MRYIQTCQLIVSMMCVYFFKCFLKIFLHPSLELWLYSIRTSHGDHSADGLRPKMRKNLSLCSVEMYESMKQIENIGRRCPMMLHIVILLGSKCFNFFLLESYIKHMYIFLQFCLWVNCNIEWHHVTCPNAVLIKYCSLVMFSL